MSLRVAPEHHQLIRDIGLVLRTRPELADVLRDVLQSQHGIAPRNTDVLQSILDRLAALEEQMAGKRTALPKPPPLRPRAIPAEHVEEAARLWDGGKGHSFSQIVAMKGWPHAHKGLNKAVRKYLQRNTDFPST